MEKGKSTIKKITVLYGPFHVQGTDFKLKTYDLQNIDKEV